MNRSLFFCIAEALLPRPTCLTVLILALSSFAWGGSLKRDERQHREEAASLQMFTIASSDVFEVMPDVEAFLLDLVGGVQKTNSIAR